MVVARVWVWGYGQLETAADGANLPLFVLFSRGKTNENQAHGYMGAKKVLLYFCSSNNGGGDGGAKKYRRVVLSFSLISCPK